MRDYEIDLFGLEPLVEYGSDYYFCGCKQTYKNTNERLKEIYKNIDFNNKDVFSVMSSADQVFSAYYLGAKNVDTFDNNWTTYYNFYLKKWYLMFYNNYILNTKSEQLMKSLIMRDINSDEEMKVYEVWKEILTTYCDISRIFFKNDQYTWNVPYSDDIKRLIEIIKDKTANFTEINLFKELKHDKKYDIIILSNILEYVPLDSLTNQIISDNLRNLLNDDGIIICSILNDRNSIYMTEREEFKPYFDYLESNAKGYNNLLKKEMPLYYTYKKKL